MLVRALNLKFRGRGLDLGVFSLQVETISTPLKLKLATEKGTYHLVLLLLEPTLLVER